MINLQDSSSIFSKLKQKIPNTECFDCHRKDSDWCSINHGIFLCLQCAGVHRSLGVHISFVRSISMDTWTPKQLHMMVVGGNEELKNFFEFYSINSFDIYKKYRTKAAYYYREMLTCTSEGKVLEKLKPDCEEGRVVVEEERKAMPVIEKEPEKKNSKIADIMNGAIAGAKGLGRNIKEKVSEISIKNVENSAKNAIHKIENWGVKEKITDIKKQTGNYYADIAESAKNVLSKYTLIKLMQDDKLEPGEDEILLDPQGKAKALQGKKSKKVRK